MKKIILLIVSAGALSLASCKKDRVCECTNTRTDSSGTVTTELNDNTTYKAVKKSEAKSICQKSTSVYVNSGGGTSTNVMDCKLK